MVRKELYRKLLKAKGRYCFICGTDLDASRFFHIDDKHVFKKIVDAMIEGHKIILHFVFPFDLKRGNEIFPFIKERVFIWENEFTLIDEFYICEGVEYNSIYDFDYGLPR